MLPELRVTSRARAAGLRALARAAVSGLPSTTDLVVDDPVSDTTFRVVVPARADLIVEYVAGAIDTAVQIKRRFGTAVPPLQAISFDHSSHGLRSRIHAGESHASAAIIHLSASLVCTGEDIATHAPLSALVGVTAHEMWHQMEAAFEARRYRDSIEFRRSLGEYFGLDTLEHVIEGRSPHGADAERDALARLVAEVSPYAGTATREATAEMFKLWWCAVGEPTGAVKRFGELLETYFG